SARRATTRLRAVPCLYVPLFPLAARLRSEPELRSEALVILEGNGPAARVAAANRLRRRSGVGARKPDCAAHRAERRHVAAAGPRLDAQADRPRPRRDLRASRAAGAAR